MATSIEIENAIIIGVEGGQEGAHRRAQEVATDTFREMMPVRLFNQGNRQMISGVLPIRVLSRILTHQAAERGSTANRAATSTNRPIIPEHVRTISDYLVHALSNNEQYIIPPMTLNATRGLEVYVPDGASAGFTSGFAVLPEEQVLNITDGMHRFVAIKDALNRLRGSAAGDKLMTDGIPVMITVESNVEQVHQDFADAGKTRPLPPSLMAVYDVRQPGNRVVHQLTTKVRLFHERIDATSTTLSIQSPYLFLVNQIRQFVKSSLSGNPSLKDDAFNRMALSVLSNSESFDSWVAGRIVFFEVMTDLIPEWEQVASLPVPQGPEGTVALEGMKKLRSQQPVSLAAATLNTLGLVSHTVLAETRLKGEQELREMLRERLQPLGDISWSRENAFWSDNLVQTTQDKDGNPRLTIWNQSTPIRRAAQKLNDLIGVASSLL